MMGVKKLCLVVVFIFAMTDFRFLIAAAEGMTEAEFMNINRTQMMRESELVGQLSALTGRDGGEIVVEAVAAVGAQNPGLYNSVQLNPAEVPFGDRVIWVDLRIRYLEDALNRAGAVPVG
jgi:hypothetical protein